MDVLHGSVGRAGVLAGLGRRVGADVAGGRGEGVEQLRMPGTGLMLPPAAEVAAPSDKDSRQDDARTDDNPVLKLAQCMFTKLKPLFDWSSATSLDSFETVLSMERLDLSSIVMAGEGAGVEDARYSETSCSNR